MKRVLRIFMLLMIFVIGTSSKGSFADTDFLLTIIQNNISITTNKTPGTVITLTAKSNDITGWIVDEGGVTLDGNSFTMPENNVVIRANYGAWPGWNEPVVAEAQMVPVKWNSTYNAWETTTTSDPDWYNYNSVATASHSTIAGNGNGKWANVMTYDGLTYYNSGNSGTTTTAQSGTIIPAGKIIATQGSQYVWIPRYSYRITEENGYNQDVDSWNADEGDNKIGKVEIIFSNGTYDTVTSETGLAKDGYIKHPAFTFGTTPLKGIWVAKYESSRNDATESSEGSGTTPASKPGVVSWTNTTVSDMFNYAYNLNRSLESHLMKNSEWGAVAYLTNAIGRIPYINNSSSRITGNAGGSQDAASASGVTNAWNTAGGVKASTTHNVYGIYDISGGAYEYVAAYLNNGNSSLSSYASNLVSSYSSYGSKYVDVYPIGTSDSNTNNYAAWSNITGDAVYETSSSYSGSTSWDGDYSNAPYTYGPVFGRGGRYSDPSYAGLFSFHGGFGTSNIYYSFRPVFSIQ